jgi:outer membrane protein OmpA-like peptidoglycan-associated protein
MFRITCVITLLSLSALPLVAQKSTPREVVAQQELDQLSQAQTTLQTAAQAGAPQFAKTLYDEAQYRIQSAQANWNAAKRQSQDEARLNAVQGLWAARAALAKARWIGTNSAVRSLQADINRMGGSANVATMDEPSDAPINRGNTSRLRIAYAQGLVDTARAAGGGNVAADDLNTAQTNLDSARKITSSTANSESADYLSYIAEMMARRALYTARANQVSQNLAPLQLQRTQLAQAESERSAAAERAQRQAAEQQQQQLQAQLAQEQANRQAQQAELDRLRQQVEDARRAAESRVEQDRAARTAAEQQLDQAYQRYATAVTSGSASDVEAARRAVEDQEIAVRALQQREQMNEQNLASEIDRLRTELQNAQSAGTMSAQVLSERQADLIRRQQLLDQLRTAREQDVAQRTQLRQQQETTIATAQQRRAEAEARAQENAAQLQAAQQAAQQAASAAQQAQQQAQAAQQQAQSATQQAQQTQAELERTRTELAARDAEARTLRMQQELARLAATKNEQRGFVVTLPGIFFDTGKSDLKSGAKSTLSRIAEQLKGNSDVRISVEGHTDNTGSAAKNETLSEKRAGAVRDFLVSNGVPADHVTATGKGAADPIASNKTAAGRLQNRRVELVITTAR